MRGDVSEIVAAGGRASVALLLSAAMAFGGVPAVALAEDAQVQTQDTGSGQVVLTGEQTKTVVVPKQQSDQSLAHDVKVEGDIKVSGSDDSWEKGAVVANSGYAQSTDEDKLTVTGDVTVTNENEQSGGAYGVTVDAGSGSNAQVEVGRSVTATSRGTAAAYGASLNPGNTEQGTPSTTTLTVGGDVQASGKKSGLALQIITSGNGNANATVGGNLAASTDESGLAQALQVIQQGEGTVNVTVGGTVKVEGEVDKGVVSVNTTDTDNLTINAWKIEAPTTGKSVVICQGENNFGSDELENPEQYINYIVKANATKKNDYASLGISLLDQIIGTQSQGLGTAKFNTDGDYSTVKGGGTLRFNVTAPKKNQKIKAVYGYYEDDKGVMVAAAEDATENLLTQNADGSYSLKVRLGGGIMLFVEYEDVEEEKKPEEKKDDKKEEQKKEEKRRGEKKEEKKPEEKKEEEQKQEESKPEEKKEEEQKQEESKPEEKKDESKQDESKQEESKKDEPKQSESTSGHDQLASTGEVSSTTSASNTLPATGDASSMLSVAMMALAGAGAVVAGRRSRKE